MSRLTLHLPETLHQQLIHLAEGEGVSLNQYIVYSLTQQVALAYAVLTVHEGVVSQQKQAFKALLQRLGTASLGEIKLALADREIVQPEEELSPELVACLQQQIGNATGV
jgi:hypothetical protein